MVARSATHSSQMETEHYYIAAEQVALALADALLQVPFEAEALLGAARTVLGDRTQAEQRRLIASIVEFAPNSERPSRSWLAAFLLRTPAFENAYSEIFWGIQWRFWATDPCAAIDVIDAAIAGRNSTTRSIASALAARLLAGTFERNEMRRRTEALLGPISRTDQRRLLMQIIKPNTTPYPPSQKQLVQRLLERPLFHSAIRRVRLRPDFIHPVLEPPKFSAIARFADLDVPKLTTLRSLADWLHISPSQLDWLSDERRQHGLTAIPILQNYTYASIPKRTGPPRLIEAPKTRLKTIQRKILDEILSSLPVHNAAYGFVYGRSAAQGAARHVGEAVVITCDLENFFTTIPPRRVHGLFRSIGYPPSVSRALTGLVTTTTPENVLSRSRQKDRLATHVLQLHRRQHLAQGSPTSPALSNLCAWRLDRRLSGLAKRFEAHYTRYADDMTFSGDIALHARAKSLLSAIRDVVEDEGFSLHPRKTRISARNRRQNVTGIVVNDHLNVPRETYDLLKATLCNAVRHGWEVENREKHPAFKAHLDGRITWVENLNPHRGEKLRRLFHQIKW